MLPAHRGRFQRISAPEPPPGVLPEVSPSRVRYEEEPPEVTRVVIRVDYADGTAREWEAREPGDFSLDDKGFSTRRTGLGIGGGDGFTPVSHAGPAVKLSFTAHPRYSLHIRTHGPWKILSEGAHNALASFIEAMGYK